MERTAFSMPLLTVFFAKNRLIDAFFRFFAFGQQHKTIIKQECWGGDDQISQNQNQNQIKAARGDRIGGFEEMGEDGYCDADRQHRKKHMQKETPDKRNLFPIQNQIAQGKAQGDHQAHQGRSKPDVDNVGKGVDQNAGDEPNQRK